MKKIGQFAIGAIFAANAAVASAQAQSQQKEVIDCDLTSVTYDESGERVDASSNHVLFSVDPNKKVVTEVDKRTGSNTIHPIRELTRNRVEFGGVFTSTTNNYQARRISDFFFDRDRMYIQGTTLSKVSISSTDIVVITHTSGSCVPR